MKKAIIYLLAITALPILAVAQTDKPDNNKESQEIIIRQKGDKDINLKVEINGDKITVNGKPLSEFNDKDITINKKKITIKDGNKSIFWNFSDGGSGFSQGFGNAFGDKDNSYNSDQAFLGVTSETDEKGVMVVEVVKESAAAKAGLKEGDIITSINGDKIESPENLADIISMKKANEEISISYTRDGKVKKTKATLGKRNKIKNAPHIQMHDFNFDMPSGEVPPMPPMTNMEGFGNFDFNFDNKGFFPRQKKIGLKIQDTEESNGVKVINVEDSSAAALAGVKANDIITEINGKKITNTDEAREELSPSDDKKAYKVKVNRGGSEMNFEIKIPKKLKTANL